MVVQVLDSGCSSKKGFTVTPFTAAPTHRGQAALIQSRTVLAGSLKDEVRIFAITYLRVTTSSFVRRGYPRDTKALTREVIFHFSRR